MVEQISGKLAREICNKFPKHGNLTLAKILFKENKTVYTSVETARAAIRRVRGSKGEDSNKLVKDKSLFGQNKITTSGYNLPEEYNEEIKEFKIPRAYKRVGIISDAHIPFHSNEYIAASLNYLKSKKIDCLLLNGDIADCYQLSRFEKDPRKRSFANELESIRQFLDVLAKHFPNTKIYYKIGNHELRYQKFLLGKAPELLGVEEFRFDALLQFGKRGIGLIEDKQIVQAGKLNILHGHEIIGGAGGVNPARSMYLKTSESVLVSHFHKTSSHTETSILGKMTTTHSIGCLCYLRAEYMPYNKWNAGFAYVDIESNGDYELQNLRILKGKVY